MERLLTIRDLKVWFPVRSGFLSGLMGKETKYVRALDGISLAVRRGEVFCLVGESGCGKTTTGKAILRLNEPTDGQILFDVPEHDWKRLEYIHERLRELWPRVRSLSHVDQGEAGARVRAPRAPPPTGHRPPQGVRARLPTADPEEAPPPRAGAQGGPVPAPPGRGHRDADGEVGPPRASLRGPPGGPARPYVAERPGGPRPPPPAPRPAPGGA